MFSTRWHASALRLLLLLLLLLLLWPQHVHAHFKELLGEVLLLDVEPVSKETHNMSQSLQNLCKPKAAVAAGRLSHDERACSEPHSGRAIACHEQASHKPLGPSTPCSDAKPRQVAET